jgi:putative transposase
MPPFGGALPGRAAHGLEPAGAGVYAVRASTGASPATAVRPAFIKAPVWAPRARAHAERWVLSLRRECLDWLLILGRRHLEAAVRVYAQHYNGHRPHRALAQQPPLATEPPAIGERASGGEPFSLHRLRRRDQLGGLLHEYELAA